MPQRIRDKIKVVFSKIINGKTEPFEYWENPIVTKNGEERLIAWHNTLLKDEEGNVAGTLSSGEDITESKRMEAEHAILREMLYHAQRLEAIGKLAGGVAHNFNNILMVILGYASMLQGEMKKDDPLQDHVQKILDSSERAAHLIQGLLAFSRKESNNPKPVKLNEIIKKAACFLPKLIGEDIELKTSLTDKDPTIMADDIQVEQVLMNLVANAKDAMPRGGFLP